MLTLNHRSSPTTKHQYLFGISYREGWKIQELQLWTKPWWMLGLNGFITSVSDAVAGLRSGMLDVLYFSPILYLEIQPGTPNDRRLTTLEHACRDLGSPHCHSPPEESVRFRIHIYVCCIYAVYIYIYIYIYIYVCMYVCIYICIYIYIL